MCSADPKHRSMIQESCVIFARHEPAKRADPGEDETFGS